MSLKNHELIKPPLVETLARSEQEEALRADARTIANEAVEYLAKATGPLNVRDSFRHILAEEIGQNKLKENTEATLTIALLEIAAKLAYDEAEKKKKFKEEGEEISEDEVVAFKSDYGRFTALREILVREHSLLFQDIESLRGEDLLNWAAEAKETIKRLRPKEGDDFGSEEDRKKWESQYRNDIPLLELFLSRRSRLEPRHYDQLIDILNEETDSFTDQLVYVFNEHLLSSSSETIRSILGLEESIEMNRSFIAMLEGEKAEKIALKK